MEGGEGLGAAAARGVDGGRRAGVGVYCPLPPPVVPTEITYMDTDDNQLDILYVRITKIHLLNLHIFYSEIIKIHIFKSIFRFPISSLGLIYSFLYLAFNILYQPRIRSPTRAYFTIIIVFCCD